MNSKVPKYSTISTNIWAELLHEIDDDDESIKDHFLGELKTAGENKTRQKQ